MIYLIFYGIFLALFFGFIFTYGNNVTVSSYWQTPYCLIKSTKRKAVKAKNSSVTHYRIFHLPWVLCVYKPYNTHIHKIGECPYCHYDYKDYGEPTTVRGNVNK